MPFGPESLRVQQQRMVTLSGIVDDSTRTLVRGFTRVWDQVASDLDRTLTEAALRLEAGERLTWRQLDRMERFQAAMRRLAQQLDDLAATGRVQIVNAAGDAVQVAREFEPRMIASQLPALGPSTAQLAAQFGGRVAGPAFDAIVERAQQRIVSSLRPLSADAQAAMRRELVRGITVGANPNVTARRMLSRLESLFAGGLTRALRVARTEQLDAYRTAGQAVDQANGDVVEGWIWFASLDDRTCIACADMHNSVHDINEPGPEGHVQCRCDRVPTTRSWRDLGFPVDEPESLVPDRDVWWNSLTGDERRSVMGSARLEAFERGQVGWGQFAQRVQHDGWRDSFQVRPLSDLGIDVAA